MIFPAILVSLHADSKEIHSLQWRNTWCWSCGWGAHLLKWCGFGGYGRQEWWLLCCQCSCVCWILAFIKHALLKSMQPYFLSPNEYTEFNRFKLLTFQDMYHTLCSRLQITKWCYGVSGLSYSGLMSLLVVNTEVLWGPDVVTLERLYLSGKWQGFS